MQNIRKAVKTLELDKILQLLSNEATLEDAKELSVKLEPKPDIREVKRDLDATNDG